MLNLTKLEQKLNKALSEETEESLTKWLFKKRENLHIEELEEVNKYKLLHPQIYDEGYNKGIECYENCMSREHTFNYLFKYNDYGDSKQTAFIEGAMDGWNDSEKEDYLTNTNEK